MRRDPEVVTVARLIALGAPVIAASLVGGCESKGGDAKGGGAPTMAEASFRPIGGSSLTGAAILSAYDGGVRMQVNFNGGAPGQYRVMIHATGNCSTREITQRTSSRRIT